MTSNVTSTAAFVDEAEQWSRLMALAEIGATANGGVNRQAFSQADIDARRLLVQWGRELGLMPFQDEIGNVYLRCEGREPDAASVMAGSHLDSQPKGGKFDGAYGVVAALMSVAAILAAGKTPRRPLEVVAWSNEEGSRFQPGTMGSGIFSGVMDIDELYQATDSAGTTLKVALAETLAALPDVPLRHHTSPAAYLEAHIEQGPILEAGGVPIGVVTGTQGLRWFHVEVAGEAGHAGTTPDRHRRDALKAAAALVTEIDQELADHEDRVRFTVGRFETAPNSPSTIPDRVLFTIDLRHPEIETLDRLTQVIEDKCKDVIYKRCAVSLRRTEDVVPTLFDTCVIDAVERACNSLDFRSQQLLSGAGHDAMLLARICPAGMIFVPCKDGVSHAENEHADPADLAAGTRVLADTLLQLAEQ